MALKKCKECGKEISSSVKKCPHCGKDQGNWFMRHKIITIVGLLILLGIIGSSSKKKNPPSLVTDEQALVVDETGSTEQEQVKFKVGDTIKTDKFEIAITSIEERKTVGSQFFKSSPSEGGIYIAVQWRYKNISDRPISSFSTPRVRLLDTSSTTYDDDIGASGNFATELELDRKILSDLNPGITVKDADVFEVSKEQFDKGGWELLIKADNQDIKISI